MNPRLATRNAARAVLATVATLFCVALGLFAFLLLQLLQVVADQRAGVF